MKPNTERLKTLAAHLLSGALGHEMFDFSVISSRCAPEPGQKLNMCGSSGCAVGEFPFIWPADWHFSVRWTDEFIYREGQIYENTDSLWQEVANWFDIPLDVATLLFIPQDFDNNTAPWYIHTGMTASATDVARNILRYVDFLEWSEKEKAGAAPEPEPEPEPVPVVLSKKEEYVLV